MWTISIPPVLTKLVYFWQQTANFNIQKCSHFNIRTCKVRMKQIHIVLEYSCIFHFFILKINEKSDNVNGWLTTTCLFVKLSEHTNPRTHDWNIDSGADSIAIHGHGVYFAFKGMKVITGSKQDLINWDAIYTMVSCYLPRTGASLENESHGHWCSVSRVMNNTSPLGSRVFVLHQQPN